MISKIATPKLTTIDYPGLEMGEIAAKTLINHLHGITDNNIANTVMIESKLIIRESSLRNRET